MIIKKGLAFFILFLVPASLSQAYWVWSPESGKFVNPDESVQDTAGEQYDYAMKLYRDKDLDKAIDELQDLLKKHRGSRIAPEAQYRIGVIYEEKGDYLKAFDAYKVVLESYPQSERFEEVVEREFRIANLFLSGRKGKLMGLEILPSLPRAIEIFEHIVKHAPYSPLGDQAQFRLGVTFKQAGRHDEAVAAFQKVIDNYPQSDLVTDARYQMAESAFLKSNTAARDQRALENAADYVDGFLMRHPDSSVSEKASKLRQEIDEKNAEKNYRVAVYYEKTNYLSSALIYYKDVAKRYPHTQWGQKAAEKLKVLEEPVSYVSDQESRIESEIAQLQSSLQAAEDEDSAEAETIKRKLDRLKERRKLLEKGKEQSLKAREEDIKRREEEWKEKLNRLDKKKELLKTNQSPDFKKAIERWEASLQEERDALDHERNQLASWKESLGMDGGGFLNVLPFIGEKPSELEEVRRLDAKKLYKVADEKRSLLEEKELLYKHYQEVASVLSDRVEDKGQLTSEEGEFVQATESGRQDLVEKREAIAKEREEINELERRLREKEKQYKDKFGESSWASVLTAPVKAMSASADAVGKSLNAINPFSGKGQALEEKSMQELLEYRMHMQEKIAAQQSIIGVLTQAFDETLAMQEQRRLVESLNSETETDLREVRKSTKKIEKEIRKAYEEITDRHDRVKELTAELETTLQQREDEKGALAQAGSMVTAPARLIAKGTRDFIFGRKPKEAELTRSVEGLQGEDVLSEDAKKLREEIELESLLIEARNREIYQLRKQLDVLKAKSSLAGGHQFRSAMVTVPYDIIEEALDSARSVVPKEDRKEALINRLDEETQKLEAYKAQLKQVEANLAEREGRPEETASLPAAAKTEEPSDGRSAEEWLEEQLLKEEIQELSKQLEQSRARFAREKTALEREREAFDRESEENQETGQWEKKVKEISGAEQSLRNELKELGRELADIIEKEKRLETEEASILEKRIGKIEEVVQNVRSKALAQDLLTEKERMEDRLGQIESRRDFLSHELDRFRPANAKVM